MEIEPLSIPEVKIIRPRTFCDERGYFSETYNQRAFAEVGIFDVFVQDNQSFSEPGGIIRGLHFQIPPLAQAKLVQELRGSILDVAVDLRCGSPIFGRHVSAEISARDWNQILVPVGFAHGFCTLEPDTEVFYKVTAGATHEGM
jgi:dTDP-4-dehydrorhamnose 3,5-epimerase